MLRSEEDDTMRFTRLEREKITDGFLSIQSAESALRDVDESKVPGLDGIHNCLKSADRTLRRILSYTPAVKK